MESMLFCESRRLKACCAGELTGRQVVGNFSARLILQTSAKTSFPNHSGFGNARIDDYPNMVKN